MSAALSTSSPSRRARRAPGRPAGRVRPCGSGSAITTRPRPVRLAVYIAASAARRSSEAVRGPIRVEAIPHESRTGGRCAPRRSIARSTTARIVSAVAPGASTRELVARVAAHERVGQPFGREPQRARHRLERPVAAVVAAPLVERLEVVDVAQQQRRPPPRARAPGPAARSSACRFASPVRPSSNASVGHPPVQLGASDPRRHLGGDRAQQPLVAPARSPGWSAARVAHSSPQAVSPSMIGAPTHERTPSALEQRALERVQARVVDHGRRTSRPRAAAASAGRRRRAGRSRPRGGAPRPAPAAPR